MAVTGGSDDALGRAATGRRRSIARSQRLLGPGLLILAVFCPVTASGEDRARQSDSATRLEALLINGGGNPGINYLSHLRHVEELHRLLRATGIDGSRISVLSADGSDPGADLAVREPSDSEFWLLEGTRLGRMLRERTSLESSFIEGVELHAATNHELREWFRTAASRLRAGDTLLLYVTDHGTRNREDLSDNRITLWGDDETLSVSELRDLIATLDHGVRVVALMSQCFSGAFANLMSIAVADGEPRGNLCGFFSSTARRPAYGCYPENRDKDDVGHSFRFIDALDTTRGFSDAHERVLVADRTPDVPLKTSDLYLEQILAGAAARHDKTTDEFIDELLGEAWKDKKNWETEIRLLDRIGQAYGFFSPRWLAELQEPGDRLPELSREFQRYHHAWRMALHSLNTVNVARFLDDQPDWRERVGEDALKELDKADRRELTGPLLVDLAKFTRSEQETRRRLETLRQRTGAADDAYYRMQVRLGVVLRMKTVLTGIAGRIYLATEAPEAERDFHADLIDCESLSLRGGPETPLPPVSPEPFPSYEDDLRLAEAVLPGWVGIRFRPLSPDQREELDLGVGATMVLTVFPDSPAAEAGFRVGDIVLGPPGDPFTEQNQIREWVMTAPLGEPRPLVVRRDGEDSPITFTPAPYPLQAPALPGPPRIGETAPSLEQLESYRGELPTELAGGGPHLLFFWATWCVPCKNAVPEVMAFARERETNVIAITDEFPDQLEPFFETRRQPFPDTVAVDKLRRAFLAYGVNGTPSFVLVDAEGEIQSTSTGYSRTGGLKIEGWSWSEHDTAPPKQAQP